MIRSGRQLYRLVADVAPFGVGARHRPSKPGETRGQARRRGRPSDLPQARLCRVAPGRTPAERTLLASWDKLGCLPADRHEWITALRHVLESTTQAESARVLEPLPRLHPGVDLTPWLSDRQAIAELLVATGAGGDATDPWVKARWGEEVDVRNVTFAPWFASSLLPFVQSGGTECAKRIELAAEALGTRSRSDLAGLAAALLQRVPAESACSWLWLFAEEEPGRAKRLLWQLVSTDGIGAIATGPRLVSALRSWRHLPEHDEGERREVKECQFLYESLAAGASPSYVLSALRLGREFRLEPPRRVQRGVAPPPNRILDLVKSHSSPWFARRLWEACGCLEGLRAHLDAIEPRRVTPDELMDWLRLVLDFNGQWHRRRSKAFRERWEAFVQVADELWERWVGLETKLREPMLDYFGVVRQSQALCGGADCREEFLTLGERLVVSNPEGGRAADVVFYFWAMCRGHVGDFCSQVPDSAWGKLAKACTSTNRGRLLEHGFARMAKADARMATEGFAYFPTRMIEVARAAGTPSNRIAKSVASIYARHPLAKVNFGKLSLEEAASLIGGVARGRRLAGVPKALRSHLDEGASLRLDRLRHYTEEMHRNGARLRLEVYAEILESELNRSVTGRTNTELPLHTVLIARHIDDNARPLRRYLRDRVVEGRDGRLEHPKNSGWIADHRNAFDVEAWLGELEGSTTIDGLGTVTFRLETDPDEVLKLGSYVGSCLGLGGDFTYSAVAALLDANKRVIYVRNRRGRVLGRQLVAVSKANRMVCFDVYGSASAALEAGFAGFDHTLAECCGLEIERGGDYEVERLLVNEWYDDGAWDLCVHP